MSQPSLFDAPAERGAYRKTGPATSREAGESMTGHVLRDQQRLVLSLVAAISKPYNRHSATAFDVSERARVNGRPIQQNVAAKRLQELADEGMVALTGLSRPGSSGRPCKCFALTTEGRTYLERAA